MGLLFLLLRHFRDDKEEGKRYPFGKDRLSPNWKALGQGGISTYCLYMPCFLLLLLLNSFRI